MTGNAYVSSSFALFALVLAWDYLAPRIKLRQVRRAIALRARRDAARNAE